MHAPVLVTAPTTLPVTLEEAKAHLRRDADETEEHDLITALVNAAVGHLDGWTGILGRCLEEQTWRQDFDGFDRVIRLPLWPIIEISSITWRNEAGQIATVSSDDYALKSDALGAYVRFKNDFEYPSGLNETSAVAVTFTAGYPREGAIEGDPEAEPPVEANPGTSTVPAAIKAAILLLVGHWYVNRMAVKEGSFQELPMAVNALIAPYRRVGL